GGTVTLTSGHETTIAGSVTVSSSLTINAGSAAHDDSAVLTQLGGYLTGESAYSVLMRGTLDNFGNSASISIAAPGAVLVPGLINRASNGSSVQIQSDQWVYVSNQIRATNSVGIFGGERANGVLLNGANSRGMSVYLDTTALIETTAAGSNLTV